MPERKLGRGLDGLLRGLGRTEPGPLTATGSQEPAPPEPRQMQPDRTIPVGLLDPNPHQPRDPIDPAMLDQLMASIREHGVLQPILVRPLGERYQVVAGERRLRAAQAIGLKDVPASVRDIPDDRMLEIALVENLQREDLDPIEKARSFRAYLEETGQSQQEAGRRLGLDRSTIANVVRLLDLPADVQALVKGGEVSMGHARAILGADSPKRQRAIAGKVVREGLSVRQVEALVRREGGPRRPGRPAKAKSADVRQLEARLRESLGTKVSVEEGRKAGTGRIVIDFYSPEDLDRILGFIG